MLGLVESALGRHRRRKCGVLVIVRVFRLLSILRMFSSITETTWSLFGALSMAM